MYLENFIFIFFSHQTEFKYRYIYSFNIYADSLTDLLTYYSFMVS